VQYDTVDIVFASIHAALFISAALRDAQAILKRLRCRDLYKIVGDRLLSPEQAVHASKAATPELIASCADASLPLSAGDIIVHQLKINYAMKDKNPVDSVSFYNGNDDLPFHLPKSKVSLMIPDVFEEKCEHQRPHALTSFCYHCGACDSHCRYLRLYVRHESKVEAAKKAWDNFLVREHFVEFSVESTQSQLLKASPARAIKAGRPPVAPAAAVAGTRLELFPIWEEGTKKKPKVDLVAKSAGDTKLTAFFTAK
jgi:hypothetical protein